MYATFARPKTFEVTEPPIGVGAIMFVLLHIPLALLMREITVVTFIHAFVTLAVGLRIATSSPRPERVAPVVAYIAGAEVLWRMTNDHLFWEMGKYSTTLIVAIALFRMPKTTMKAWPLVYMLVLLPSALLTLAHLPASEARNQLSFNLSGPLALAMCAGFFSAVTLQPAALHRMGVALVAAVSGIATITLFSILTNPDIAFSHQSNFQLSGGFGPNQVSAALGLGMLMALLVAGEGQASKAVRLTMLAMVVWFGAQSALTFSRGGVFCTLGAASVAALFYVREPRALGSLIGGGAVVFLLGYFIIWPRLDEFTGGNLSQRFTETDTSLRADLTADDLATFEEHPLVGVGPGMSKLVHLDSIISHTEFTRLLAEHGGFGVLAMLLMAGGAFINVARGVSAREKALAAAFMTWSVLFMSNSAMRLVAPAFTFGLASATFAAARPRREPAEPAAALAPRWRLVASR